MVQFDCGLRQQVRRWTVVGKKVYMLGFVYLAWVTPRGAEQEYASYWFAGTTADGLAKSAAVAFLVAAAAVSKPVTRLHIAW